MDASLAKLNNLALAYADIQVSPQELVRLNALPMTVFIDETVDPTTHPAGYQVLLSGYAKFVRDGERKTKDYRSLADLLRKLRAMPRPIDGFSLKNSVDTYSINNHDYRIDYRVASGQVVVFNIQPVTKLQKLRDAQEKPSLYYVKKSSEGIWRVSKKADSVSTKYGAVNGQSNNLVKATWLMGSHLDYEFGKGVQDYTLFHNPSIGGLGDTWESTRDKFGLTTDVTKRFSRVLEATQAAGNETSWLAHSQGAVIFSEGVRYLLNGNSSWALNQLNFNGLRHPQKEKLLDKQSVALHGNANNNWRCKPLFDRAGVKVLAIKAHDYDMVANIVGANTVNPRKLMGSVVYANHVFGGSVLQSPHTLAQDMPDWERHMTNGPGKGRNVLQKAFRRVEITVEEIKNYLP